MLRNYIKIAWRNLRLNRGYSTINILGLALGMCIALLIGLWIIQELRYDRFYSTTTRLYQVFTLDEFEGKKHTWGGTSARVASHLKEESSEIEEAVRISNVDMMLGLNGENFKSDGISADPAFFKLFDYHFIAGDAESALADPTDIVLTKSMAEKIFNSTDVVGKTLDMEKLGSMRVGAIIEDIPNNSRFSGTQYFCSFDVLRKLGWTIDNATWTAYNHQTFVLLHEGASLTKTNNNIADLVKRHNEEDTKASIYLYPASRWHLYNKSENGKMVAGNLNNLRIFGVIGIFVLLIACINFINLSTAGAERRSKEVGVRKVIGAQKSSLVGQFLTESLLLAALAGIIALAFTWLSLPFFNQVMQSANQIPWQSSLFWLGFIVFICLTGILAGIYPAFFLSAFQPIKTLKGLSSTGRSLSPRRTLVVLQFTISIALAISTIIITQQIQYGQKRDSGYQPNKLIYAYMDGNIPSSYSIIRQELLDLDLAQSITKTQSRISATGGNSWGYTWPNSKPEHYDVVFNNMSTDADFTKTMGIKLLSGRDIDIYKYPSDSTSLLINQAAAERMNLSDPIGAEIFQAKGTAYEIKWKVVGVIADFISESPYSKINPMFVKGPADYFYVMHIRLNPNKDQQQALQQISDVFKKHNPNYPVDLRFVDENYAKKFDKEKRTAKLTATFSALAIFIACLGLFGLVAYAVVQRRKEIGVRKVLGASISSINTLISKEFLQLVILAFIIASPIAWWAMNNWLDSFTYRIKMDWWMFILVGIIATLIALITVSLLAIRAARANPVDSLRDE